MTNNERITAARAITRRAGINASKETLLRIASDYHKCLDVVEALARFADYILSGNPRYKRVY